MTVTVKKLAEKYNIHDATVRGVLKRSGIAVVVKSKPSGGGVIPAQYPGAEADKIICDYVNNVKTKKSMKAAKKAVETKQHNEAKKRGKRNWTGLEKGDKITITNKAGRSWTGFFIKSDSVFGYMEIANKQTQIFAKDAQIRKANEKAALSASDGELLRDSEKNREFWRRYSEALKSRKSIFK